MGNIRHWPRETWIGEDGRRWVTEAEATAMRDLYIEENEERARLADQLRGAVEENERLRAFAFGDAPEWEKANATLKHRVRELEAEIAELRGQ